MKLFRIKQVKYRIMTAIIGLLILSIFSLSTIYLLQVLDQTKSDYETAVTQQLKIIDKSIDYYIANIVSDTEMLSGFPMMKEADNRITSYTHLYSDTGSIPMTPMKNSPFEQQVYQTLQNFKNTHSAIQNVSLGVASNGGFVKSPPSKRFNGYDARTRDWYIAAAKSPEKVILSSLYKTSSEEYVIFSVKGILDEHNRLKGVISLDFDLSDFSDMISKVRIGEEGYAILVDANGNIMAHPKNQEMIGKPFTELDIEELKTLSDLSPKKFTTTLVDGKKYRVEIVRSENPFMPLFYIALIEEKEFYSSIIPLLYKILFLTLLLFSIAIAFSIWISGIIASPLEILGRAADEIASGNLDKRINMPSDDDVGELANRIDKMTEALQQAQIHLEEIVKERTDALQLTNKDLQHVNQELGTTINLLEETQEQLIQSEKLASLGTLVAGIAHEINTPVGVAITACSFVSELDREIRDKYKEGKLTRLDLEEYLQRNDEALQMVMRNLERASSLIQSFKQVAVDQTMETPRVIPMRSYLDEVFLTLKPKLMKSNVSVHIKCDPELQVHTYPSAVFQVVTNFVMNALLHAYDHNETGTVNVSVADDSQHWHMVFEDDGNGMSPEIKSRIFDPFFTTKRNSGGTGLGLHIVYNIVTLQLGGEIVCESLVKTGTRFILKVPKNSPENF